MASRISGLGLLAHRMEESTVRPNALFVEGIESEAMVLVTESAAIESEKVAIAFSGAGGEEDAIEC